MATRAARGAGYPIGQAEDLGATAAYLAGIRADVAPITQALQEDPTPLAVTWEGKTAIITAGATIFTAPMACDAVAMGGEVTLADISQAPLISAMLCTRGLTPWWEGTLLREGDCEILPVKPGPVDIPDADWQIWKALAARTYVPESAASRAAGAGAGLTDND